ncbi:MAG: glycosyl hydrolase 115 family protein, partial [Turicibacter sp.]|nr:glycosyl hydrolase 115 family protein [Turicibacter sp.]
MESNWVIDKKTAVHFILEKETLPGVMAIAEKVTSDFKRVGLSAPITSFGLQTNKEYQIIFATLGNSEILGSFIQTGKFDASKLENKSEVFAIQFIDDKLLIAGSDKRGTIYGMFALSEYIGVSPLHYWGDVEPAVLDELHIGTDIEKVSKEPSVKYRGFFINDEWPCFGNWATDKFGGASAAAYDHIFELLLRLKGNYIWPAMWASSFALDGPGDLNEELADMYGVVVGASHHEPCLRASEEWEKVRGADTPYGTAWNYYTNKDGLNNYWEDGLKRSGKYEKIITIGMRGEYDSEMLGKDATVQDNVDLLKDVITNQRALIKKHSPQNPELLALYKEVEEYFYGSDEAEGLKDWEGLDGVICMLCEDNFGFMRTLPTPELGERQWGMYYHFDYHGGPVSYEWMPSTPYEKTWEQLSMAYEYGVRDVWIVNVGDLKFNEVPLAYFMELAYDFETYGTSNKNSVQDFTKLWLEQTFPMASDELKSDMGQVLHDYIRLNGMRRPEALNAGIYHPAHYLEADRMLWKALELQNKNQEIYESLSPSEQEAYYSTIYFPAMASANLLKMHLYAAKNAHYAKQGKKIANLYKDLVTKAIVDDRLMFEEFGKFKDGKWKGMELEEHIGFTVWNDDNCRYPLRMEVEPFHRPRLVVSRKDDAKIVHKAYGNPMALKVDDFLSAGNEEVFVEIANDGLGLLDYTIQGGETLEWLEVSSRQGSVEFQEDIRIYCHKDKLGTDIQTARLLITDGDATVAVDIQAKGEAVTGLPTQTFLENNGVIAMDANHYFKKTDTDKGGFEELANYGRSGTGMKVFPITARFEEAEANPKLSYRFNIEQAGEHTVEIWTTPTNPIRNNDPLRLTLETGGSKQTVTTAAVDFLPYHTDAN